MLLYEEASCVYKCCYLDLKSVYLFVICKGYGYEQQCGDCKWERGIRELNGNEEMQ